MNGKKGMKIPYGKYKGVRISEIPTDYLKWIIEPLKYLTTNKTNRKQQLSFIENAKQELLKRKSNN